MSNELPRGHWRRNVLYVGYLCPCCVKYVHPAFGDKHREWCERNPQNDHVAGEGGCLVGTAI